MGSVILCGMQYAVLEDVTIIIIACFSVILYTAVKQQPGIKAGEHSDLHGEVSSDLSSHRFSTVLPPTPTDPLPGNWKTVDGAFTMVAPLMAPAITADFVGHPNVHLGSGDITILYMLDDTTRWDLVTMMLEGGSGNWVNHHRMLVIKAKAYRIEPLCSSGVITIDGEVIEYGATQTEVHRHVARVFSRKRII